MFATTSLLLSLIASTSGAWAQEPANRLLPPDVTILNLSESASTKVAQDRIQSTLRLEERGGDPATLQSRLNEKMQRALMQARRYKGVDVTTGGYNVYRVNRHDEPNAWQASQSIHLDSDDATMLLNLTGSLQKEGFLSGGMTFYLSREKSASLTDDLLEEALRKLTLRAQRMGKVLGKTSVQLAEINHGHSGYHAQPMYEMAASQGMRSSGAKPVAEGGDQDVQVNVSAVVYLRP